MSAADTNTPQRPFPHLAISDLLVLTLTAAFGMVWSEALGGGEPLAGTSHWAAQLAATALQAFRGLLLGVELFGFAVVVRELFRGRPLRTLSPGHWWFVVAGPQRLLDGVHYLIAVWGLIQFNIVGQWRTLENAANVPIYLVIVACWLGAAIFMTSWRWRAVFAIKSLEQAVWLLYYVHRSARNAGLANTPNIPAFHFYGVSGTLVICQMAALLVAVAVDFRQRVKRDWLHYLGVAVIFAEACQYFGEFGHGAFRWWANVWSHIFP